MTVGFSVSPGVCLQLRGQLAADRVGDVDLAALQCGKPCRLFGDHLQHQPLHADRLAPVALVGLQHQFHARLERDELVRPGADRRLLEAVVADLLDILLRHDPAGTGGRGIEGQEIRPGILQLEREVPRIGDLHRGDPVMQRSLGGTTIALEGELHVLRRHLLAVVERHAVAQHEAVAHAVFGRRPGFRQAVRHQLARHRLQHRVVQRVVEHVRRDERWRLGRIEPGRRQRDVHAIDELPRRTGRLGHAGATTDRGSAASASTSRRETLVLPPDVGPEGPMSPPCWPLVVEPCIQCMLAMRLRHHLFSEPASAIRAIVSAMRQPARMLPPSVPATFELPPARHR